MKGGSSVTNWKQTRESLNWAHGHSYYGDTYAQFACWDCGKDLKPGGEMQNHCWDCMAKFCDNCWGFQGLKHDDKHHSEEVMAKQSKKQVTVTMESTPSLGLATYTGRKMR